MEGKVDGRVIGEIGVAIAVERLLRAGFYVAMPIIDDGYDLLAFDQRRHWRIQVKASLSRARNAYRIRIARGRDRKTEYLASHVDAFMCVNVRTNVVMCVPVEDTKGKRWLSWSQAHKWSDLDVLRRIKTPK